MTRNRPIPDVSDADRSYVQGLVIHDDAAVLGFAKPAGLPVQTRGNRGRNLDHMLWAFARSNGKRPKLVHRLDVGTSGVIVAAKTQPAAAALSEGFASRTAEKTYLALVSGTLPEGDAGSIDAPLARVSVDGREKIVAARSDIKGAKSAQTHWRLLHRSDAFGLMELKPKTGRMHQIRVHLEALGCPILGDPIYGSGRMTGPRVMLHAQRLKLPHPDGGMLDLETPVPPDFEAYARKNGLLLQPASSA